MSGSKRAAVVVLMLGLSGGSCEKSSAQPGPKPQQLATTTITLAGKPFKVQIADDEDEQQMGLMYRDSMPADHGMIFIFPDEEPRGFWMKNTRIPLDIIYLNSQGRIVSIKSMRPYDLTTVPSDKPAQFAIELNQGTVKAINLKVGDQVQIPATLPASNPATQPATDR